MSGRNPPSYYTLILIAMRGHQQKGRQNNTSSNNKDKYNTIIETRTAEDDDDENLHNPETVQDAVIHLEVDVQHIRRIVCVCVFFPFILDIKFVRRTSRSHTGGRSQQDFSSTFFLRCVP